LKVSIGHFKSNKAKIDIEFNNLSNGGSDFIEIGQKLIVSKTRFAILNDSIVSFGCIIEQFYVEFNYLSIGNDFIEIGHKLIELWSCDVFA
jgi:hypothetical protein